MGVLAGCKPRQEVLKGDLDDAIFAADFGDVIADRGPEVYREPATFFRNTHPARELCRVVQAVFGRLADPREGGATIRLSTGFGGGKTHTLISLWHLANHIADPALGAELLPAAGRPKKVTVVAVDASKGGLPVFASHDGVETHSLWGEIFYRLGGEEALAALGTADNREASPSEAQIEAALPSGPLLFLLDELVIYMAKLSDRGQGNMLGFLGSLFSVVGKRPQTALLVTDPADQRAYAREAAKLGNATSAAVKLDEMFGRKMTDFDPIGDESSRVIVRRLFEEVAPGAAQRASALYHDLYERVSRDHPGEVPLAATTAQFARRFVECYPFHPRLMETAQDRLGAMGDFQKSRGVLRLFARILRDVWESGLDTEVISAGDVNWSSHRIQGDLLQRLNRESFKTAVNADVQKHAGELDGDDPRGIHCRVASALLLESIPMQASSGLDKPELTLAVLRPEEAGHEPGEALDRLVAICWHSYPLAGGRGWQFRYEPNVIKQIEERMASIPLEDARSRVLQEIQQYFSGPQFKVAAWPSSPRQLSESADLQLVLCDDEVLAKRVCAHAPDSEPEAPMPRRFRNTVVAVAPTPSAFGAAAEQAQRLLAALDLEHDYQKGDSGKLVREQILRVKPQYQRTFRHQAIVAFDRVVLPGGLMEREGGASAMEGPLEAGTISVRLEDPLQSADDQLLLQQRGQTVLRKFLDAKKLIYQPTDSLDVDRFMKELLPGSTPLVDKPEVYTAKAVHERFLSMRGIRLIPDKSVVRETIKKAVAGGELVVKLSDGRAHDATGYVDGPDGARRRVAGVALTTLTLDDTVMVTRATTSYGIAWMREDEEVPPGGPGPGPFPPPPPPPPSPAGIVTVASWDRLLEYAADRPLLEVRLTAATPTLAKRLIVLAQPLGADRIILSVTVDGVDKEYGTLSLKLDGVKPNHAANPLQIAGTLYNSSMAGAVYEAVLTLSYGTEGRWEMLDALKTLSEAAGDGVIPRARFGKPASAAGGGL